VVVFWVPKTKIVKDAICTENDSYSLLGLQRCLCEIVCHKGQPSVLSCTGKHLTGSMMVSSELMTRLTDKWSSSHGSVLPHVAPI